MFNFRDVSYLAYTMKTRVHGFKAMICLVVLTITVCTLNSVNDSAFVPQCSVLNILFEIRNSVNEGNSIYHCLLRVS